MAWRAGKAVPYTLASIAGVDCTAEACVRRCVVSCQVVINPSTAPACCAHVRACTHPLLDGRHGVHQLRVSLEGGQALAQVVVRRGQEGQRGGVHNGGAGAHGGAHGGLVVGAVHWTARAEAGAVRAKRTSEEMRSALRVLFFCTRYRALPRHLGPVSLPPQALWRSARAWVWRRAMW